MNGLKLMTWNFMSAITRVLYGVGLVTTAALIAFACGCRHPAHGHGSEDVRTNVVSTSSVSVVVFGMEKSIAGNCPGSELDARRFRELMEKIGYGDKVQVFLNNRGTIANFERSVTEAVKSDLAIIYYSGHGGSDDQHRLGTGANEDDGVDEFLCLYDGYYLDDRIWNIVSGSKGRVFIIFDCCHSQTMMRSAPFNEYVGLMSASSDGSGDGFSLLCWSGCPDNTYSYGSNEGGMFTLTLLRNWKVGMSYERLWQLVSRDQTLQSTQKCQQTLLGGGWNFNIETFK